jgi:hypothetical protein
MNGFSLGLGARLDELVSLSVLTRKSWPNEISALTLNCQRLTTIYSGSPLDSRLQFHVLNQTQRFAFQLRTSDTPVANSSFVGQTHANEQTVLYHDRD